MTPEVSTERKKKIQAVTEIQTSASEHHGTVFCPWPAGQVKGDSLTQSATVVTSRWQELSNLPRDMVHSQHLVSPHQLVLWESACHTGQTGSKISIWVQRQWVISMAAQCTAWRYVALDGRRGSRLLFGKLSAQSERVVLSVIEFDLLKLYYCFFFCFF